MPTSDPILTRWFAEHVQPHETMLRNWLRSRFGADCEVDDVIQEAFARVVRAYARGEVLAPKAFLFATARNLAFDHLRRRHLAPTRQLLELHVIEALEHGSDIPETVARNQELALLAEAIQTLPERCRRIFTLRKLYGLSQREIADKLGISERTVSAQLTIGVHKCTAYLRPRRDGKRAGP